MLLCTGFGFDVIIRQWYASKVSTTLFKMASTTACHKRKGNADEDSNCCGKDDISECSDVTDFSIKEWWQLRDELNNYPDFIHMKDLKQQKRY